MSYFVLLTQAKALRQIERSTLTGVKYAQLNHNDHQP